MHAATLSSRRQPADAPARSTNRANRTAAASTRKARGVLDIEACQFDKQIERRRAFPDSKATLAEVRVWQRTGRLPKRLAR